ncbi:MAG: aspartate/glutamate racemase family protein [Puniceicoccaceae bacterium]
MSEEKTLALIHTSMVFVKVETMMSNLFREIIPGVRLINIVDDSLLPDVMSAGMISDAVQERMNLYVESAEKTGANAVFSLCSSLGPTIDAARQQVGIPVVKIDDAMAMETVRLASRIGVMATVETTLQPTCDLIAEKATEAGKQVEITPHLVGGAFEMLMGGGKETHDSMVESDAIELAKNVEIIVFAQASMTRLAPHITESIGKPVLTSPRLGIEYVKKVLENS